MNLLEGPEGPELVGRVGRWAHGSPGQQIVQASVWVLAALSLLGFIVEGANRPADPHVTNYYLPGTAPAPPARGPAPTSHP